MKYKTFTAHNHFVSYGSNFSDKKIFLTGGFYDWHISAGFRKIKTLVLCTELPSKESQKLYGNEFWFVPADLVFIDQVEDMMKKDDDIYLRREITLVGNNKIVTDMYTSTSYSD